MARLANQVTSNIGLYYTCYKLSRMGWNVMPTSRNARGIDIVAYSKSGGQFIGVQVKALSKRNAVPLGRSVDELVGDFWIIVNNVATEPNAFIMLPAEGREGAHRNEKNGRVEYWLEPNVYDAPEFKEAWQRIAYGDDLAMQPEQTTERMNRDVSLSDELLASNPKFRALVAKSKAGPRKPFRARSES